jgi:hypothetical protein
MAALSATVTHSFSLQYRDCTNGIIGEIHTIQDMIWQCDARFADAVEELSNNKDIHIYTQANTVYIIRRMDTVDTSHEDIATDNDTDTDTETDTDIAHSEPDALDGQQPTVPISDDMDAELQSLNADIFELLDKIVPSTLAPKMAQSAS